MLPGQRHAATVVPSGLDAKKSQSDGTPHDRELGPSTSAGGDIRYPDVGNALSEYGGGFMLNTARRSAKRLQ
jgi:hypothetical protein